MDTNYKQSTESFNKCNTNQTTPGEHVHGKKQRGPALKAARPQ